MLSLKLLPGWGEFGGACPSRISGKDLTLAINKGTASRTKIAIKIQFFQKITKLLKYCYLLPFAYTRYRAASGGPRSPFGFEEAFKGGRGIQGGKSLKKFSYFSKSENFIFLYSSLGHGESIGTFAFKIGP